MANELWGKTPSSLFEKLRQDEVVLKLVGQGWLLLAILLVFWTLYSAMAALDDPQSGVAISEFMASNNTTLADGDGDCGDWIEVHNGETTDVHLDGWYLTDDDRDLTKWQFPPHPLGG